MFPKWLTKHKNGAFIVDEHAAYPIFLQALDLKPDQYGLEVAYQCIKLNVQELVAASGEDPRDKGESLRIMFDNDGDKEKWAIAKAPAGRGTTAASQGLEAKAHWERIRGKIAAGLNAARPPSVGKR